MAWKQIAAKGHNRNGNSPYKYMLQGLRFPNTDTRYLKDWIINRSQRLIVDGDIVTIVLKDKIIQTKTIAEGVWTMFVKYGIR
jgi:hypothetical protein